MSKYDALLSDLAKPRHVTPLETARAAAQAVQTSLFQRLRKAHGGPLAGRLAWMLVRAGDSEHPENGDALMALAGCSPDQLQSFVIACRGARDTLRDGRAAGLARLVVEAIESAIRAAGIG